MGMKQGPPEQHGSVERLLRADQRRVSDCWACCLGIGNPGSGVRKVVFGIGAVSWLCKESGLLSGGQERGHRRGETVTWGRQNVPKWFCCDKYVIITSLCVIWNNAIVHSFASSFWLRVIRIKDQNQESRSRNQEGSSEGQRVRI